MTDYRDRVTEVGASTSGTFDRTVYTYNGTTGLLSQVTYHSGGSSHSANYHYDDAARVVKLTDWIDNVDGIQYEYDALGRLDTVRDYDGSELTYTYDDVGNIASMTDYHNNTINYTYTARDQLYTLTAPGSKVWTYTYNALGQPTRVDIPNGMHTEYAYDTRNRLTEIAHKDGSTVKQSFGYTLDDDGTITRITHEDGSYWDYDYDGRNRLIAADRKSQSGNIVAEYDYTYDDADNMLTKVEPFEDDFEDGAFADWWLIGGTWSAASKALLKTDNGTGILARPTTDANNEVRFDYRFTDTSTGADYGQITLRHVDFDNQVYMLIAPGFIILAKIVGGTATTLDTALVSTTDDQWYTLRAESDGANVTVWRSTEGELETEILSTTAAAPSGSGYLLLSIVNSTTSDSPFQFDNIRILADDLDNTTTFAYNTANELTSMTGPNGTTTFTYDDWGSMLSKSIGGESAAYAYRYGGSLSSVASTIPGEGNVTYEFGGDDKLRSRVSGSEEVWYNYAGFSVVSEENDADGSSGNLSTTNILSDPSLGIASVFADISGTDPSTGTARYYVHDRLTSTRGIYSAGKAALGRYGYGPYGTAYHSEGAMLVSLAGTYTGARWDATANLYPLPYRAYDPVFGRWLQVDPMRMVDGPNMYAYVRGIPVMYIDPYGYSHLFGDSPAGEFCNGAVDGAMQTLDVFNPFGDWLSPFYDRDDPGMKAGRVAAEFADWALPSPSKAAKAGKVLEGGDVIGFAKKSGRGAGPSGKPKIHSPFFSTRKKAKDAARRDGAGKPEHHGDHFHPVDKNGKIKKNGKHYCHPRR